MKETKNPDSTAVRRINAHSSINKKLYERLPENQRLMSNLLLIEADFYDWISNNFEKFFTEFSIFQETDTNSFKDFICPYCNKQTVVEDTDGSGYCSNCGQHRCKELIELIKTMQIFDDSLGQFFGSTNTKSDSIQVKRSKFGVWIITDDNFPEAEIPIKCCSYCGMKLPTEELKKCEKCGCLNDFHEQAGNKLDGFIHCNKCNSRCGEFT